MLILFLIADSPPDQNALSLTAPLLRRTSSFASDPTSDIESITASAACAPVMLTRSARYRLTGSVLASFALRQTLHLLLIPVSLHRPSPFYRVRHGCPLRQNSNTITNSNS